MTVPAETTAPNLEDLPLENPGAGSGGGQRGGAESQAHNQQTKSANYFYTDEDLPPLRLNATRVQERLSSSTSALCVPNNLMTKRRRSLDLTKPRSRSRSPSLTKEDGSSVSSLEDFDSDILTDRMGLEELPADGLSGGSASGSLHVSVSSLPPVNERLSEDTLEDVHAFSDIQSQPNLKKSTGGSRGTGTSTSVGGSSRGGSIADVGSVQLETLDECEDEETDDMDGTVGVHISNMENLTIEEEDDNASVPTDAADGSLPTEV
uniref:Uncharacterized protein n=1 Tax=Cyclophora tenuis TaxID=216820 RepID=A0A7S1D2I4_CYCTE|mmetsp:Transcript_20024/g.34210  ORF Transcript_20024/g.34210 Transcript_20024/m.34210 type:complete len:264 (+) Transcript_20024:141-932(+)